MLTRREWKRPAIVVGALLEATQRRLPALPGRMNMFVEDVTKPLLLGYIRRDLLVTDSQVNQLERQMTRYARAEGFSMGFTYVEKPGTWPAAFEALMESVIRYEVTAVVLPSQLHFAVMGASHDIRTRFEQATGARVLVLDSP